MATPKDVTRQWCLMDAEDIVLGRLASEAARRLRGKHKPIYTPYLDTGDFIIVVNAAKVRLTGNKLADKVYYRHSRYPGGMRSVTAGGVLSGLHPERVIEAAVRGMLPKNKLGRQMFRKLKIYAGAHHPHEAQQPVALEMKSI
ncbi:MAG: 50S ribosomal protein L13 [Magnetococcales bacterium]|nr:50S ribosomal protein L13 [Magnetococcales bacterium]